MKRASQPARLLAYLEQHNSITRLEAFNELGIANLWTRITDLERLGHFIEREDVRVPNRLGQEVIVTKYSLTGVAYG